MAWLRAITTFDGHRVDFPSGLSEKAGLGFRVGVPGMRSRNAIRNAEFWVSRAFPFRVPRSVETRPALPSQSTSGSGPAALRFVVPKLQHSATIRHLERASWRCEGRSGCAQWAK